MKTMMMLQPGVILAVSAQVIHNGSFYFGFLQHFIFGFGCACLLIYASCVVLGGN
jgi:hypothetical protein